MDIMNLLSDAHQLSIPEVRKEEIPEAVEALKSFRMQKRRF